MLDPRIYRAAFLPVLFALVLVGFSLREQPRGVTTTLAPEAFDGEAAFRQLDRLATAAPQREPGSAEDQAVARTVEQGLRTSGFDVSVRRFDARTSVGKRTVETVIGERTGFSSQRILVVAQRDAIGTGARAQLSGTAALLELARVLGSRTLKRTLVLASISGGPAAAKELAEHAGGDVDAVIVLGDLAGTRTVRPVVVPWADGEAVAPLELRRTVETAVAAETGAGAGRTRPFYQFTRLAFPLTLGLQGPFNGAGLPAVLLSVGGERPPAGQKIGVVEILSGKSGHAQYHLTKHVSLIGAQDDAVITLTGWFAPKTAAMISRRGEGYVVSQTESGKRILVNGRHIQGEHALRNGDVVEVAGLTMRFLLRDPKGSLMQAS